MAIQKEIWERAIVEDLFADNSFLSKAVNADMWVNAGKVVHIPQAGAAVSATTFSFSSIFKSPFLECHCNIQYRCGNPIDCFFIIPVNGIYNSGAKV